MSQLHAHDALVIPPTYRLDAAALSAEPFSSDELDAMRRHVWLAGELLRCRYFTQKERSMRVTMDEGVTTSFEQRLPDAGATRDMLGLLRQLFGDGERSSFASMVRLLRWQADTSTPAGRELLTLVARFESVRQGVLESWDA